MPWSVTACCEGADEGPVKTVAREPPLIDVFCGPDSSAAMAVDLLNSTWRNDTPGAVKTRALGDATGSSYRDRCVESGAFTWQRRTRTAAGSVRDRRRPSAQTAPAAQPEFDGFKIGSFTFKPGGRIKLDVIRDFDPITSEDSFDPRTIPVDGSEGTNSQVHARETRLTLDMRGPVEGSELRMYVETDFYGSGNVLRLRQAFGSYKGLMAGQAWSTFVDDANFPNTIDFESPMAFPSIRQAQARFTAKLGANASWSVAVEDNKSSITTPADVPGKAEYSMPDLTTRVKFEGSRGHVFASAFLGRARFRPTDGEPDDVSLWGSLLSGRVKTFGSDYAYAQFTFGDGVGRYRGGVTAVPDAQRRAAARRPHRVHGRLRALLVAS